MTEFEITEIEEEEKMNTQRTSNVLNCAMYYTFLEVKRQKISLKKTVLQFSMLDIWHIHRSQSCVPRLPSYAFEDNNNYNTECYHAEYQMGVIQFHFH